MTDDQTTPQRLWPKHVSWLTIVLALLAVVSFVVISRPNVGYPIPMFGGGMMESVGGGRAVPSVAIDMPTVDSSIYYPYPYPTPDTPITDTREFLKVYYNASMRTRDVPALTRRVETAVRGYSGRIDQISSSREYGSVGFAIPQARFDAFRTELESFVGSRFLTVNISSQNLLPQKLSIEEQLKQVATTLADYKTARQKLVTAHTAAVQALEAKIDADTKRLETLRLREQTPSVTAEIQTVSSNLLRLEKQLASENKSYADQLNTADQNIKNTENWQKAVETQDETLLSSVATVTGTVSLQWISFWDMTLLYLPGYSIPTIFAVLAFLSFLRDRRRFGLA